MYEVQNALKTLNYEKLLSKLCNSAFLTSTLRKLTKVV